MEISDTYKTVSNPCNGIFKEKGSRFLAFVYPVSNEQEVKEILLKIRKEHHGARHNCFAWRIGPEMELFRLNDDGEPSGTAGRPIFGQIQLNELTDILIIVVRYFGGILLGTSGLINAYKQAAADALCKAVIIEKVVEDLIEVSFDYSAMNDFMHVIKEMHLEQVHTDFNLNCYATISVRKTLSETVMEKLEQIDKLKASIIGNKL